MTRKWIKFSTVSNDDDEYEAVRKAVLRRDTHEALAVMIADWKLEPTRRRLQRFAEQARIIRFFGSSAWKWGTLVQPFAYDRIYGAWWDRVIESDARQAVATSVARYLRWIAD